MKIGTDAWMIDASPESIRVSPHESSQNGIAVLIESDDDEPPPVRRALRADSRAERQRDEDRERDRGERDAPRTSVAGASRGRPP